ncbi:MAG TPA: SGNH/GDSL hydrolase family protein [Nocardioidaceae bacterium]|nr:SGNH/GDSL hydrolase family protein [Nocardioidaceae bacterium]
MGKVSAARKLAAAAAFGGGGLSVLGGTVYGLLRTEAAMARRAIGDAVDTPPDPSGWYGTGRPGPTLKIALLGDSGAAGYGVTRVEDTPGARIASGVAEAADRRLYLSSFTVVGAQTRDLDEQITKALALEPHAVVMVIGGNDVTHGRRLTESVRLLRDAVRRIREAGVEVIVGTCPDLGTVEPLAPPLKQVARTLSRRLAAAQAIAVVEAGGRTVSLASILGPEFKQLPSLLFGPDRFHPSAAGYSRLASVLVPPTLAALGLVPEEERAPEPARGDGILPIAHAAVAAARVPGTEIEPQPSTAGGVPWGRFVQLRHRRRRPQGDVQSPAASPDGVDDSEPATAG